MSESDIKPVDIQTYCDAVKASIDLGLSARASIIEKMGANVFALPGSQEVLQPGWFSMKRIPEHGEPGHQSGACGKCNRKG